MQDIVIDYNANKGRFEIAAPFIMNGVAKSLPSRRWNKAARKWFAPAVRANAAYIRDNISVMGKARITEQAKAAIADILTEEQNRIMAKLPSWYKPKLPMRKYQKDCADKFFGAKFGGLFMCCGSGKTKVAIDLVAAKAMENASEVDSVVVACPYSVRDNWLDELSKHCPIGYEATVLDISKVTGKRRYEEVVSATDRLRVIIVGIESLSSGSALSYVDRFMGSGNCAFILDEMSKIKTHNAKRTKRIIDLGKKATFRLGLTGTPVTQGLQDLYSQMEFLSPNIIGYGDYYSFRNRYLVMGGFNNKQIIGYDNVDELLEHVNNHVFQITWQEALPELPPRTYVVRRVSLTPEQRTVYNSIKQDKMIQDGDNVLTVKNALEQMLRLQQVTGGFVPCEVTDALTGNVGLSVTPVPSNKVNEVVAVGTENESASVIVWARFRAEIELIATTLRHKFGNNAVVEFHGGLSAEERWESVRRFENNEARFLVGNQATGGIGINLIAASIVIYYSNTFSLEDRIQSEARNFRMGQKNAVTYIDLVCSDTVDDNVREALVTKQSVADYVRDSLGNGTLKL